MFLITSRCRVLLAVSIFMASLSAALVSAPAEAHQLDVVRPALSCEALAGRTFTADGSPVRVSSASPSSNGAPNCVVQGYVAPQVKFELRLPMDRWTQRMLFTGCGGFCGAIRIGAPAAEGCAPVVNGTFALVSSNLGHEAQGDDAVWASGNPQGVLDFGSRGVHVTALAARAIIAAYYGQSPTYSYFSGCSDGGREAMMEAQRFPGDFNGIVAGAPVINVTANNSIYHSWIVQNLLARDGSKLISDAVLTSVNDAVIQRCDGLDGAKDGIVALPERCDFQPEQLICRQPGTNNCLTREQAGRIAALYAGPVSQAGVPLYFGLPLGSERTWNSQAVGSAAFARNFTNYLARAPETGERSAWDIRYDRASIADFDYNAKVMNALDPDLGAFQEAGGKLIMWHGWSDVAVPPGSSISYTGKVRGQLGKARASSFIRLYMLPGVNHCGGGAGPDKIDLLTSVMKWVEDGIPPETVRAVHRDGDNEIVWNLMPDEG